MSSIFTKMPISPDQPNWLIDAYIQFVPGQVVEVVTSRGSKVYNRKTESINSIIALPHITNKPLKETTLNEGNRYKPLLRGMVDVPVKGDPVLLCTFGGANYYLGPLNTQGLPNFNVDISKKVDIDISNITGTTDTLIKAGISRNFPFTRQKRLEKYYNEELDNPLELEKDLLDIHGDMLFEGRHGNSIRLGSRSVHPYITISNYRTEGNATETTQDGTLLFMGYQGSIRQHFKNDGEYNPDSEDVEPIMFTLADSKVDDPIRNIQNTFSTGIGRGILDSTDDFDADVDIYEYSGNQTLLSSDRLTFNARKDSIFMSSFQFLHFGAGDTITFSTNNNIHLSAETRVVIDSPIIKLGTDIDEDTEPIVKGDQLVDFLKQLMVAIKKINNLIPHQVFATGAGPTAPGPMNAGGFTEINTEDIKKLEDSIEDILSTQNRTT